MSFITNKSNTDYSEVCLSVYRDIRSRFGSSARITRIWELLPWSMGFQKFEILEPQTYQNGTFDSWLMDRQADWMSGKDVNFNDIYNAVLEVGDFTSNEKLLMKNCDIEQRLWGILLAITNPNIKI